MKEIKLANDRGIALVDDEDYEMLSQYKWSLHIHKYVITNIKINNKFVTKLMHRLLINPPKDLKIDHIDHNGLNNQKENLRIVTYSQNQMNRLKYKNASSSYKGVYWNKQSKMWRSQIGFNNKKIFLGQFINEKDAAIAYNIKAKELFKEYAYLNEV